MQVGKGLVLLEEGGDLEPGPGCEDVVQLAVLLVVRDVQVHQLVQLRQHAHLQSINQSINEEGNVLRDPNYLILAPASLILLLIVTFFIS